MQYLSKEIRINTEIFFKAIKTLEDSIDDLESVLYEEDFHNIKNLIAMSIEKEEAHFNRLLFNINKKRIACGQPPIEESEYKDMLKNKRIYK
jgi:hypothetical protein